MRDRLSVNHAQDLLERLRDAVPLTHCITNGVVMNFTANALLAIGAAPAMVDIVGEAGPFARVAGGLLVNLGTPTPEQRDAAREAVAGADAAGTPWVLDPVAIGALPIRTALAHELAARRPTVIRGNASEILALAGDGAGGRGVDAADTTEAAADAAGHLARTFGSVVAVSGPVDLITDGVHTARVANGDALLTRVTGGGCALGAIMAAFLAVAASTDGSNGSGGNDGNDGTDGTDGTDVTAGADHDAFDATVAATLTYTVAAELAAGGVSGPGSFASRFLDALASITPAELAERAQLTITSPAMAG